MSNMDVNQKFCLKWNNFQSSVTSVFDNLRQDEELVDITLCCEGKKIKAHRMMLSACSPYFRDLLKENPCQHPVFFLKDTSHADLAAIVEFVYKGEVNVTQHQLASFLKTAEMLQVRGLAGEEDVSSPAPAPQQQHHQQQQQHKASRASGSAPSPSAGPGGRSRAAGGGAASPSVKRRRVSSESSPPDPGAHGDFSVKQEPADGDGADGDVSGFSGGYEPAVYEAAAADVAGFLSAVGEPGGSGDAVQRSPAGPSDDGSQQGSGGAGGVFTCRLCSRQLLSPAALSQHMAQHAGRTQCPDCGRVLSSKQRLITHRAAVHGTAPDQRRRQTPLHAPAAYSAAAAAAAAASAASAAGGDAAAVAAAAVAAANAASGAGGSAGGSAAGSAGGSGNGVGTPPALAASASGSADAEFKADLSASPGSSWGFSTSD